MNQNVLAQAAPKSQISDVEAWLKAHHSEMYTCPELPGQPRITRDACLKRRSLALEIFNRNGNESLFDGGGPVGILTCVDCVEGKKAAGE